MLAQRITFVGFGLLASSIASAIRQAKLPVQIRVVSSPKTLERAKEMGLADETFAYHETADWVSGSDLILLCSPILHILEILKALSEISVASEKEILVSDIGSTKSRICAAGFKLPKPFLFVGGHPMAGSEKRTLEFNDPSLFENAYWFVCPPPGIASERYQVLSELIAFLGSREVLFEAAAHDRTVAWLSHMPQMLSSTLAGNLPVDFLERGYQHFAGRGFRDMTRIAASGWNMWRDILLTNQKAVSEALSDFAKGLEVTRRAVESLSENDCCAAHEVFESGNRGRASLFAPENTGHSFYEVTVPLEDRSGTILEVIRPLAEAQINIREIELMKVRENIAGTLLLGFKTENDASRAVEILNHNGLKAAIR